MRLAHRGAVIVAGVAFAIIVAGCTSPKNALGSHESPCFRALAVAKDAVPSKGRFAGVRYVTESSIAKSVAHTRHHPHKLPPWGRPKTAVCVVGYSGKFTRADLPHAFDPSGGSGTFAVVVVRLSDSHVLGTALLRRPPISFSRTFTGPS